MNRRSENLLVRKRLSSKELKVRNRNRIDKRKYYGVGKNIKSMIKTIEGVFYNKFYFSELDSFKKESIENDMNKYFEQVNEDIYNSLDSLRKDIENSFEKGSKRITNTKGEELKSETPIKKNIALRTLQAAQVNYLINLKLDLQSKVQEIIIEGLKESQDPKKIAKEIQSNIKGISKTRANTIARSEIVKSHNLGQVETMRELDVKTYIYWTAQDQRVSVLCRHLQGSRENPNVYDLSKAGTPENPLPVSNSHPNCRCTILVKD